MRFIKRSKLVAMLAPVFVVATMGIGAPAASATPDPVGCAVSAATVAYLAAFQALGTLDTSVNDVLSLTVNKLLASPEFEWAQDVIAVCTQT
jgi:hypothetical protein